MRRLSRCVVLGRHGVAARHHSCPVACSGEPARTERHCRCRSSFRVRRPRPRPHSWPTARPSTTSPATPGHRWDSTSPHRSRNREAAARSCPSRYLRETLRAATPCARLDLRFHSSRGPHSEVVMDFAAIQQPLTLTLSRRERAMEQGDAEGCRDGGQQRSQTRVHSAKKTLVSPRRSIALSRRERVGVRGCGPITARASRNSDSQG